MIRNRCGQARKASERPKSSSESQQTSRQVEASIRDERHKTRRLKGHDGAATEQRPSAEEEAGSGQRAREGRNHDQNQSSDSVATEQGPRAEGQNH